VRHAQRAFVAVRDINPVAIGPALTKEPDITYRFALVWENNGSTETRELELGNRLVLGGPLPGPGNPKWSADKTPAGAKRVLLPKATTEYGFVTLDGVNWNATRDGQSNFFLFGFAKYRDIFDGKHLTLACFHLIARPGVDYTKEGAHGAGG